MTPRPAPAIHADWPSRARARVLPFVRFTWEHGARTLAYCGECARGLWRPCPPSRSNGRRVSAAVAAGLLIVAARADPLDSLDEALSFSAAHDQVRAHISGLADLEGYSFDQPPPGLIRSPADDLFNPRLTLFLDAQAGEHIYLFAQARLDRGFDPEPSPLRGRLDEYAIRFVPGASRALTLQIGKFATVVGSWTARHDSWNNPFISAPLPYENLAAVWDALPARTGAILLSWAHLRPFPPQDLDADKQLRLPILWGPSYATGTAAAGRLGAWDYAIEVKNAPLSSRPEYWTLSEQSLDHPTVSGRLGWTPSESWRFGFSASTGPYLDADAVPFLLPDRPYSRYRESVLAQDASFAWHHFQAWAEAFETRFQIPGVSNADTVAYYLELKYRFVPQLAGAIRWNQEIYGKIPFAGTHAPWGRDVWRIDLAPSYRFTAHLQAKVQYSLGQGQDSDARLERLVAGQLTLRF